MRRETFPSGKSLAASLATPAALTRGELFAGLFVLGFVNGIADRIEKALTREALWDAFLNTFEVSVIVWIACGMTISFLVQQQDRVTRSDWICATGVLVFSLVPFAMLNWISLTYLGLYLVMQSQRRTALRRGAVVLLAITVPMFWSRLLFAMASDQILQADAVLASYIVGTERVGNTIKFADGWGYLFIGPPCSSLANVSLAMLGWALCAQVVGRASLKRIWWGFLACAVVIVINVTRIGLIGLHREHFELLHGAVGATAASWLALIAIISINVYGFRRDLLAGS